jgi:hypothetical protein
LAKTSQLTGQTPEATQLGKTEQITGQPSETTDFYTIPNAEMDQVTAKQNADFYTIPNSEMDEVNARAAEAQANVDDVVSEGEAKIAGLEAETASAQTSVDTVAAESEGTDIKGLDSASSRVIRMIPGLREAQRIYRGLGALSEGSLMGGLGLLLVAYSIYKQISAYLEEQKQQQAEYKKTIMELRGFTTSTEFTSWQTGQRQAIEGYRSGIIP